MLIYLLKMITCSAAFYGLYALLFRNEKMLVFNRFYLLTALILSCVIPFITFTVYLSSYIVNGVAQPVKEQHDWVDYAMIILAAISILVSFIFLVRFTKNLLRFKKIASGNHKRIAFKGVRIVLLQEPVVPHSFLNTIFLNSDEYQAQHIEKEILEHELAHIRQKHSWDILFVELLQIFYWFNPFIYLYKRSIKINHELLADAAVVKKLDNRRGYQHILLQRAGAQPTPALASSFHFFITKKRIIMLQKKTNPVIAGLKAMLSLPLLALLVFVFSERVYAQLPPPQVPATGTVSEGKPSDVELLIVENPKGKNSKAVIKYKSGKKISADVSTAEKREAFEKEYGVQLSPPPPPAPPSRKKQANVPPPLPPSPAVAKAKAPLPPPTAPIPSKKVQTVPPPPPPKPPKEQAVSFTPPVIVKDKEVHSFTPPAVVAAKKVKPFAPPVIVKDEEVQKIVKESSPADGVDSHPVKNNF